MGWQFGVWPQSPFRLVTVGRQHSVFSIVQLTGSSLALVDVLLTNFEHWLPKTEKEPHSDVHIVSPATKKQSGDRQPK